MAENFRKNTDWQIKFALILLLITIIVFFFAYFKLETALAYSWFFGLTVGFILQRSRICFTAALRDPFLFGLTKLTRALVLSLLILSIAFALVQYHQNLSGMAISGKLTPLGWHIPLGALIFGVGASISGGCASGTLMRLGEGYKLQWVVIIAFIGGSVHGSMDVEFWYGLIWSERNFYLPDLMGWNAAFFLQIFTLVVIYIVAYYWEKYKF